MKIYAAMLAMLCATLWASRAADSRPPDALAAPLESIPHRIGEWSVENGFALTGRAAERLRPTAYLSRTYARDGRPLDLFVAYYSRQRAGETMHSPRHCLPGGGWDIWKHETAEVPFEGRPREVNLVSIENSGRRMTMLYWHQSRRRVIAGELAAKLFLARDALVEGTTSGAIVRIIVPDDGQASRHAGGFAAGLMPEVQRCLGR